MAKKKTASRQTRTDQLASMIDDLRAERQGLADRMAEIDATFDQLGIAIEGAGVAPSRRGPGRPRKTAKRAKGPGRPAKKKTKGKGRRKRGSFARTGEESVLAFVGELKKATAGDVNQKWTAEGRGGSADNTLGRLVKEGKLQRENVPGQRGGLYKLAK